MRLRKIGCATTLMYFCTVRAGIGECVNKCRTEAHAALPYLPYLPYVPHLP